MPTFSALHRFPRIRRIGRLLVPLLSLAAPCHAAPPCAASIVELRALLDDPAFPLQWRETTMDDGKPLVLSILERDGALFLSFVKARDGLWAEGSGAICARGAELEARFMPDKLSIGPAAHWALRYSLGAGMDFTLVRVGAARLRIATTGWSGLFSALPLGGQGVVDHPLEVDHHRRFFADRPGVVP